jgi:hypothetical protein
MPPEEEAPPVTQDLLETTEQTEEGVAEDEFVAATGEADAIEAVVTETPSETEAVETPESEAAEETDTEKPTEASTE